jgi:tetratricopeptide (TPR) repeat protein
MRSITTLTTAASFALVASVTLFALPTAEALAQRNVKIVDEVYLTRGNPLTNGKVDSENEREIKYLPDTRGARPPTYTLDKVRWISSQEAPDSFRAGFTAMTNSDWPTLAATLELAITEIEADPRHKGNDRVKNWLLPAAYYFKGYAHQQLGEAEKAQEAFEKVPTASRFLVEVAPALAGIYKNTGKYAQAADKYAEVRKLLEHDIKTSRSGVPETNERAFFKAYLILCE